MIGRWFRAFSIINSACHPPERPFSMYTTDSTAQPLVPAHVYTWGGKKSCRLARGEGQRCDL
eukprot:scaffold128269_cov30-Tisochrysis_lutea.AAC.1